MNNNDANVSQNLTTPNGGDFSADNSNSVSEPVILESMTIPIDLPAQTNLQDNNFNQSNSQDTPIIIESDKVDESTSVGTSNSLENSIPDSIQIPIMHPDGEKTDTIYENNSNDNVDVPESKEDESLNIKVGALGKLSKKKKKIKEKELAKESLKQGNISKKVLIFPIIIIIILIAIIVYLVLSNNRNLSELRYECSPINSSSVEKQLDVNSTIVKELYSKVKTNIREDIAQPEWNDKMKIYLAYRQIIEDDKNDSNCNLFNPNSMEPYTCVVSSNFRPKAFSTDILRQEWKLLYGEDTEMPLINIKLENSCVGGYQYIAKRDEYVQGYCDYQAAPLFKVSKKLVEAVTIRDTIILKEEVRYYENEKLELPSYLVSGDYYYTFRLDMNYNYVFISKKYNDKY